MLVVVMADCVYGPFDSQERAQRFADFLTTEVDPARVETLMSPVDEVLAWYTTVMRDKPTRAAWLRTVDVVPSDGRIPAPRTESGR